jgi:hypothetical protein
MATDDEFMLRVDQESLEVVIEVEGGGDSINLNCGNLEFGCVEGERAMAWFGDLELHADRAIEPRRLEIRGQSDLVATWLCVAGETMGIGGGGAHKFGG